MATASQKRASKQVLEAVAALNEALLLASNEGLFVEIMPGYHRGRNASYSVDKIETREVVLP